MNPFDDLNGAMRDRDTQFTKREMIAMHMLSAQIASVKEWTDDPLKQIAPMANKAIMAADILLDKLRTQR